MLNDMENTVKQLGRLMICAALVSVPGVAAALTEWGKSGDWTILVDPETGNGCLMQKDTEAGIRVRFGYVPDREGGFISALSRDWTDVEPGTTGTVKFVTDEAKFAGDAEMIEEDDWKGGWAFFNNPNFVVELAKRRSITVIGPKNTFDIGLTGSAKAIDEMKKCQAEQD